MENFRDFVFAALGDTSEPTISQLKAVVCHSILWSWGSPALHFRGRCGINCAHESTECPCFLQHCRLAKKLEGLIKQDSRFEIMNQVILGLVCFRLHVSRLFSCTNKTTMGGSPGASKKHLFKSSKAIWHAVDTYSPRLSAVMSTNQSAPKSSFEKLW